MSQVASTIWLPRTKHNAVMKTITNILLKSWNSNNSLVLISHHLDFMLKTIKTL
jgi:hypothetical protein